MSFKISENESRMFSSNREVDRCIFCGGHKEVKKKNFFSNSCCSSFENKGKVIEFLYRDTMTVTFELDNQLKGDLKANYLEIAENHKKKILINLK